MGCRELDITSYFKLTHTTVTPSTPIPASPDTSEKSRRGFKPVIPVSIPNYRYYSAELGRWLSRDSIGEAGGYNLYGMVNNNPINLFDLLGMYPLYNKGYKHEANLTKNHSYVTPSKKLAEHHGMNPKFFQEMPMNKFAEAVTASKGDSSVLAALIQAMQIKAQNSQKGYHGGYHPSDYASLKPTKAECDLNKCEAIRACTRRIALRASALSGGYNATVQVSGVVAISGAVFTGAAAKGQLWYAAAGGTIVTTGAVATDFIALYEVNKIEKASLEAIQRYCRCCE